MKLWHQELIEYLPRQKRECCALQDKVIISTSEYNNLKNLEKNFEHCLNAAVNAGYEQAIKQFKTFIFSERNIKPEGAIILLENEVQDFFNSISMEE